MSLDSPPPAGVAASEELPEEAVRLLRSTYGPSVLETDAGSAGLYALLGHVGLFERRYRNPVLVAGIASAAERLDLARALAPGPEAPPTGYEPLGVDLVAACVNELLVQGALPLFFLSHVVVGESAQAAALELVKGIAKGCRQADCALLKNALERGPGGWHATGFAVGMVERARMLDGPAASRPGDAVLGIAASGLQGCGLGRARQVLLDAAGLKGDSEPPELACPLAEELLRPSRIYVRAVRALLERYRVKGVVHGVANVVRGGLAGSLAGVLGRRCVARIEKAALPRVPALGLIQRLGGLSDEEMFRTFNMGVGMAATVAPFYADAAIRRIRRAGEKATVIGQVAQGDGPAVELV